MIELLETNIIKYYGNGNGTTIMHDTQIFVTSVFMN